MHNEPLFGSMSGARGPVVCPSPQPISCTGCYIKDFSGTHHSLLAQTLGDLFLILVTQGIVAPQSVCFSLPTISQITHLFSCAWILRMSSKREEFHVDCRAAKAAKFFLVCESHINSDTRVKIPAAMMAKGYSNKESKNWTLQMQVYREVENQGIGSPPPPKAVAAAATALLTLLVSAPPNAMRVTLGMITPNAPLTAMGNYDPM
jgi:hypothetical protein